MADKIAKGKQILGVARTELGKDLQAKYEKGASVRALAEGLGRSYGFVHRILEETGVVMRSRGEMSGTRNVERRRPGAR
ncbi:helix-turn-helix domain-containing protein [Lentzea flaviverrucosa]|uniref:Helix-turn-helix domain-containing protein n=1 Tax=Lentzea flaviverrucosa TaxID=200379 RepID=A0A1H9EVM6_9PSEU|nr:helix-turn-helix domain-containing protein [Lentzea flaviverrucosa]RDI35382.1 hypothetical protein DFR72_1011133 [Lentzea flaviverrucosa]SEQ29760.1 hypothetical protein SAMN05216195_10284 [Lentzea flaviverrucosa]